MENDWKSSDWTRFLAENNCISWFLKVFSLRKSYFSRKMRVLCRKSVIFRSVGASWRPDVAICEIRKLQTLRQVGTCGLTETLQNSTIFWLKKVFRSVCVSVCPDILHLFVCVSVYPDVFQETRYRHTDRHISPNSLSVCVSVYPDVPMSGCQLVRHLEVWNISFQLISGNFLWFSTIRTVQTHGWTTEFQFSGWFPMIGL